MASQLPVEGELNAGMPMKHLLVVDDDVDLTAVLHGALTTAGYQVSVANDGQQALLRVRRDTPDALITDLIMPTDGVSLCRIVRQEFPNLPIVALTGGEYPEELAGQCDVFLRKPVSAERLIDTLRQVETSQMLNSLDPPAQALRW